MPFPLDLVSAHLDAPRAFDTPRAFGAAVLEDARQGGGTVVPGEPPSAWLPPLVASGALDREEAIALCAGLMRVHEPAVLTEAARTAASVGAPELGALLALLLDALDLGVLLDRDPVQPPGSVEDALVRAWADLADLDDPEVRHAVVTRARNAGLAEVEIRALARHGSPAEIRDTLASAVADGLPAGVARDLVAGLARGGEVTDALIVALGELGETGRTPLWAEAQRDPSLARDPALLARLSTAWGKP